MKEYPNLRAALATLAAVVGAGFASGREIMTFFARLGPASYIGVAAASACAGLLGALIAHFAKKHCAKTFPGIYSAELGPGYGASMNVLYGLLLLLTGAAMCAAGGELGALVLPIHFSRPFGIFATLLAALSVVYGGRRALAGFGALLTPMVAAFYLALLVDKGPPSASGMAYVVGTFSSLPMALLMGALYAAFNLSVASGALCLNCEENISPRRVGLLIGGLLFLLLMPANAVLLRAGPAFHDLALPAVMLASRWGVLGFYACVVVFWIAVTSTLSATLAPLIRQAREAPVPHMDKLASPLMIALTLLLSLVGFSSLVDAGYPIIGWACAFALLALLAFL